MNLTLPILPRMLVRLGGFFLEAPISKQVSERAKRRNELLRQMQGKEKEILRLRPLVAAKQISIMSITPELREWVLYTDEIYYKAMAGEYTKAFFDEDAFRVEKMAKTSRKQTIVTDDGRGNIVSETTTASGKAPLSNAVEFEVG